MQTRMSCRSSAWSRQKFSHGELKHDIRTQRKCMCGWTSSHNVHRLYHNNNTETDLINHVVVAGLLLLRCSFFGNLMSTVVFRADASRTGRRRAATGWNCARALERTLRQRRVTSRQSATAVAESGGKFATTVETKRGGDKGQL